MRLVSKLKQKPKDKAELGFSHLGKNAPITPVTGTYKFAPFSLHNVELKPAQKSFKRKGPDKKWQRDMRERWGSKPIDAAQESNLMRIDNINPYQDFSCSSKGFRTSVARKDVKNELGRKFHEDHIERLAKVDGEYERKREEKL